MCLTQEIVMILKKQTSPHQNIFSQTKNIDFEQYIFRQVHQQDGEKSTKEYHTRLHHLVQSCQFANTNYEIRAPII